MSTLAPPRPRPVLGRTVAVRVPSRTGVAAALVAAGLVALALVGRSGERLGPMTAVEVGLVLAGGLAVAAAILRGGGGRAYGAGAALGLTALAAITALSITWAVEPSEAWIETNRTLAYLAAFLGAIALARLGPARASRTAVGTLLAASVALSAWALLTRVFPAPLDPGETYARLRAPFDYWNATGIMAALGVPCALWLGARREGRPAVAALAYPALGVLVVALLLSYSRGALLAAVVVTLAWFVAVPLRLRSLPVLAVGAGGGVLVSLWVFSQAPLASNDVPLLTRYVAGRSFGWLLAGALLLLLAAGLGGSHLRDRHPLSARARRRIGAAALGAAGLAVLAALAMLATGAGGLRGHVDRAWHGLVDPTDAQPTNDPGRFMTLSSERARYWREGIALFRREPLHGVGAGGYGTARDLVRQEATPVQHAHSFLVQTASDLGLLGLAAVALALGTWMLAAARALGARARLPWRRGDPAAPRPSPLEGERLALATLVLVVLAFAVQANVDWTWNVPGTAVAALGAAGWVAGRGPLRSRAARAPRWRGPLEPWRLVAAVATVAGALVLAWVTWQPQRAAEATHGALRTAVAGRLDQARALSEQALARNPLSVEPLLALSAIERGAGRLDASEAALLRAVRLQPANPRPWIALTAWAIGERRGTLALRAARAELALDPVSPRARIHYLIAARLERAQRQGKAAAGGLPRVAPPPAAAQAPPPAASAP